MKANRTVRYLLTNDWGGCFAIDEPMGVEHLQNQVDMLVGTQVDTLCWNLGLPGAYRYDTKVSTRWGQGMDKMPDARRYRVKENLESLLAQGMDPLRVVLDRGREKGIKVYPSVRIYDCQMGGEMDPLNRSHPEWRIGEDPACGGSAMTGGRGLRAQLDHARPEVRQRMVDVVDELLGSYQVEGLELDFERRPHFFKPSEAVANRHLMTDMLRKIRAAAQRAGEASGKPVEVICRVWMDLSDCWNLGLDVRTWVEEGLIDILVSTNHIYFSLDNRLEEYVDLAKGTPVKVFMSYCPVLNGLGPGMDSGSVPTAAGQPVDTRWVPYVLTKETWYAAAQMAFAKGATGLASFNFSMIARAGAKWDRSILSELADPTFVARQNKLYPFITGESLNRPQRLGRDLVSYQLYVADDPAAVSKMMLEVYVTQTTTKDRIAFSINGQNLSMTRRLTRPDVTGGLQAPEVDPRHFFECELKPGQIEKGPNELSVQLTERNPEVSSPLTVVGVNIRVECES